MALKTVKWKVTLLYSFLMVLQNKIFITLWNNPKPTLFVKIIQVWLQIRLESAELELVLSLTEKSCIASYYS